MGNPSRDAGNNELGTLGSTPLSSVWENGRSWNFLWMEKTHLRMNFSPAHFTRSFLHKCIKMSFLQTWPGKTMEKWRKLIHSIWDEGITGLVGKGRGEDKGRPRPWASWEQGQSFISESIPCTLKAEAFALIGNSVRVLSTLFYISISDK